MAEITESDIVGDTFLRIFLADLEGLVDALAGYSSIVLRCQLQTGKDLSPETLNNLDADLKNGVVQWSDEIRRSVLRCHVKITALHNSIPEIELTELTKSYEEAIKYYSPPLPELYKYVFEINKQFIKATLEKMIRKMDSFYEQFATK